MLDKNAVANSFSRAADTYDQVAVLQRDVGHRLLQMIPSGGDYKHVIDLGCGTGYFIEPLLAHTSPATLSALDIAPGMLAKAKQAGRDQRVEYCCADAEDLPLSDNSIDIIFANLVLQWCPRLEDVFHEVHRVLRPGGQLLFSTFGPASLQELRNAWADVDDYVHVNRFDSMKGIQQCVNGTRLDIASHSEKIIRHYPRLNDLTHELKALGAHNVNSERPPGLTGRARIRALVDSYETLRDPIKGLPATYEIYYLRLTKSNG